MKENHRERALRHLETYPANLLSQLLTATQILDEREDRYLNPPKKPINIGGGKRRVEESDNEELNAENSDHNEVDDDEDAINEEDYMLPPEAVAGGIIDEKQEKRLKERREDEQIGLSMILKDRRSG